MKKQSGRKESPWPQVAIGERVFAMGKRGTVKAVIDMNYVSVELDNDGGTFSVRRNETSRLEGSPP